MGVLNYHKKKELFSKSCGYTPSGGQKKWWLGRDEKIGEIIFHRIKSEWEAIKQAGGKTWTTEKINEIEDFKSLLYGQIETNKTTKQDATNKKDTSSIPFTFYQAIDHFNSIVIPQKDITEQWARDLKNRMISIKDALPDLALIEIDKEHLQSLVNYYKKRPHQKVYTKKQISIITAKAQIKTAKCLFDWLEDELYWKRCKNYKTIFSLKNIKWKRNPTERLKSIEGKPIFDIEELLILYQNANWKLKEYMIFALNCGFTQKEIDRLLVGECNLNAEKPYIKRIREKTQGENATIGKWELWQETIEILKDRIENKAPWEYKRIGGVTYCRPTNRYGNAEYQWVIHELQGDGYWEMFKKGIEHDKNFYKPLSKTSRVFLLDCPLVYLNDSGAKTDKIGSAWWRLTRKCEKVRKYSFKSLRKTSADFVEKISGSEKIAEVFLSHSPTTTAGKSYTDPDYERLAETLRELRQMLEPVFNKEKIS